MPLTPGCFFELTLGSSIKLIPGCSLRPTSVGSFELTPLELAPAHSLELTPSCTFELTLSELAPSTSLELTPDDYRLSVGLRALKVVDCF